MTRTLLTAAIMALALQTAALPAVAQAAGLTLEEVQRKYRKMSPVFIVKCDRDGNDLYDRSELLCVSGIYSAMYLEK